MTAKLNRRKLKKKRNEFKILLLHMLNRKRKVPDKVLRNITVLLQLKTRALNLDRVCSNVYLQGSPLSSRLKFLRSLMLYY